MYAGLDPRPCLCVCVRKYENKQYIEACEKQMRLTLMSSRRRRTRTSEENRRMSSTTCVCIRMQPVTSKGRAMRMTHKDIHRHKPGSRPLPMRAASGELPRMHRKSEARHHKPTPVVSAHALLVPDPRSACVRAQELK